MPVPRAAAVLSPGLLTHWTREAMEAARAGDDYMAGEIAGQIAERAGVLDLLAACRVVADTAVRALCVLYRQPDADRGEVWVLDQLGSAGAPARLFAARLVTAYANSDDDHVTALVAAAAGASPAERAESLRSLMTYAAWLDARAARHHLMKGPDDEH